jgi:hypothetical protein
MSKAEAGAQLVPYYKAELVPPQDFPNLNPSSTISVVGLIKRTSPKLKFGAEPSLHDFRHAAVTYLENGLYIPTDDASRYGKHVEHVIEVGAKRKTAQPKEDRVKSQFGVAFQPVEFNIVAHSPGHLGAQTVVKTLQAHSGEGNREASRDGAKRSGGHAALETKIDAMSALRTELSDNNEVLYRLVGHLLHPHKVRLTYRHSRHDLALGVEKIHNTAELASIYLELDNIAIVGLHRAIKKHIWSGNYSNSERGAFLVEYLKMVGVHNKAKNHKISLSIVNSKAVLRRKYQTYLDEEKARRASAEQPTAA